MQIDRVGMGDMLLKALAEMLVTWWGLIAAVLVLGILLQFASRRLSRRRGGLERIIPRERDDGRGKFPGPMHRALATRRHKWSSLPKLISSRAVSSTNRNTRFSRFLRKSLVKSVAAIASWPKPAWVKLLPPRPHPDRTKARDLAFRSINSKRLDFLIIDHSGLPALAVEYQGHGHYQNRAFMRDAVKREAVRKAKVKFLEIPAEYDARVL